MDNYFNILGMLSFDYINNKICYWKKLVESILFNIENEA